jgi:glycopeptide antibiotics resistance protein
MKETFASDKMNVVNIANRIILGMGIAYLLFIIWAILWKCGAPFIGDGTERAINLWPFNKNTRWELQFNIVVFVPFGFYLAAHNSGFKLIKLIAATFLLSFALEAVQFAFAIGRSDITDLLMNTLGGIVGIVAFYVVSKLFGKHERKATLVICVLLTLLELYMTVSFIVLGQLNIGFMVIKL